jgi:hypothetical protein
LGENGGDSLRLEGKTPAPSAKPTATTLQARAEYLQAAVVLPTHLLRDTSSLSSRPNTFLTIHRTQGRRLSAAAMDHLQSSSKSTERMYRVFVVY